ncbi:MAG: peptidoglycan-associated lipoprotein Pal [Gammaproteobacteria bacterium]|nr:peptidoglycan-associated lipoprotein Pal [Gammaproteobacteria bacterium]
MKLKILSALIMTALLSACSPDNVKDGDTADAPSDGGRDNQSSGAQVGSIGDGSGAQGTALSAGQVVSYDKAAINDVNSVLAEKVIYFDFDSDQISQDYMELIAHHGKYLAANTDMSLKLEGHGDERGTREYNVALGNRRAQAVRRLVLFQGADASQISVVSFGEEKPVALGHDEEAWRLNRRVEFVYEAR